MAKNVNSGAFLTIDLAALKQNYQALTEKLSSAKLAAVVKANAYGLGVKEIATALSRLGCSKFFVASLEEGIELRHILPKAQIYILHGVLTGTAKDLIANSLIPVLNSLEQIQSWQPHAKHTTALHIDTGMSRLGLTPEECKKSQVLKLNNIST